MTSDVAMTRSGDRTSPSVLAHLPGEAHGALQRMFADPYLLSPEERTDLVGTLRASVAAHPEVSELRVLLGMALCVNLEVPDAVEELREGVRLAPDSYIAHLKFGELWMRLRVCDQAEEHTRRAALLAGNPVQVELARRQAATIRELRRKGVRRGGQARRSWRWIDGLRGVWRRLRPEPGAAGARELPEVVAALAVEDRARGAAAG